MLKKKIFTITEKLTSKNGNKDFCEYKNETDPTIGKNRVDVKEKTNGNSISALDTLR